MKKQSIQDKIKKHEEAIVLLKEKLNKDYLNNSNSKYLYIKEIDAEVEIEVHDKNKSWNTLKQIYGNEFETLLLTKEECEKILKNPEISKILKMDGSSYNDDFFIQNYNEEDKARGRVAGFCCYGNWSYFYSGGGSDGSRDFRGVRFVRKKITDKR